jgi:Mn2+/Fe2+ NRAMP family transporter
LGGVPISLNLSILLGAIVSAILVFLIFMTRHNFFMTGTRADEWTKSGSKMNR